MHNVSIACLCCVFSLFVCSVHICLVDLFVIDGYSKLLHARHLFGHLFGALAAYYMHVYMIRKKAIIN